MDDILIATKTVEKHLQILKSLLERLSEFGLELKLSKCKFLQKKVEYLGYTASIEGIKPTDSHIEAIKIIRYRKLCLNCKHALGYFPIFGGWLNHFR